MTFLTHLADRVLNTPLLLAPEKAAVIASVLAGRIGIEAPELSRFEGSPVVIDEQGRAALRPYNVTKDGTAVITITGSLVNRGAWVGANSGLTSYEGIQHQLKTAMADPKVKNVVLDIHSGGGEAVGAFETAAMVRDVAAQKPVTAVVNGFAASAAYAIASGATDVVTTPSGVSGSIGVISLHVDASQALENEGLKPTLIIAGAHKADGNPFGPLPDSVKADFQARINSIYEDFLSTVAAGRGPRLDRAAARATEARTLIGQAAVDAGLADRVGTFESVLRDLTRAAGRTTSQAKGQRMSETNGGPAAETNAGITQAQLDAAVNQAKADGSAGITQAITAERGRVAKLDGYAKQYAGNEKAQLIISAAKADGTSAEATAVKLIQAGVTVQAQVLNAIQQDDQSAHGAGPAAPGNGAGAATTPDGWKAEWEASDKLKAEFPRAEHYIAFKKADAGGQARVFAPGRAA